MCKKKLSLKKKRNISSLFFFTYTKKIYLKNRQNKENKMIAPVLSIKFLCIVVIFVILQMVIMGCAITGMYNVSANEQNKRNLLTATMVANVASIILVIIKGFLLSNKESVY